MAKFVDELRRRKVIKVAIAYLIGAWVVIQIADVVIPNVGLADKYITVIIALTAAGFPIALFLCWLFDITPAGIVKTNDVKHASPSIAVLPFPDMSAEQDQEYFCDGLTEELVNVLSCIPKLRVASRTSTFSVKGKAIEVREVAARFNVQHVLSGSVRKSGNRIRVAVQLVEAATDTPLWSATYDRELDDIFAIQDDIAACVLAQLKLELAPVRSAAHDTDNAKAYEYFLRGRGYAISKSDLEVRRAAEMFLKAVNLDADFTRAWMLLSEMCALHVVFFGRTDQWLAWTQQAESAIERLLPGSAESFVAKGHASSACSDFQSAKENFEKAIQLDASLAHAYHYMGRADAHLGHAVAAATHFSRATELAPDDYESPAMAANRYQGLDDMVAARAISEIGLKRIETVLQDYPDNQRAYYLGAGLHEILGDPVTARQWVEKALSLNPSDKATLYNAACFYARSGETDRALDLLEGSITARHWIENDSDMDSLRHHQRYKAIIESLPG